jgi:hypothetical protein
MPTPTNARELLADWFISHFPDVRTQDQALELADSALDRLLHYAPEETNPVSDPAFNLTYHCDDIPGCQPLRVFRDFSNRNQPRITSAWQLGRAALEQVIASGGLVYLSILTDYQPPVWLDGAHGITPELQAACEWPNGGEPSADQTAENLAKQQAAAVSNFAATFIAGLVRSLGFDPNRVESDGVFFQPHVENIGRAALEFFSLWPDQCNDETVAGICGQNDTLFRAMDGYQPLRQALDAWKDDARVVVVNVPTGEAQAAVDALVAEALPSGFDVVIGGVTVRVEMPSPNDLGQFYLDTISRSLGMGYQPTLRGNLSSAPTNRWRHQLHAAASEFFGEWPALFTPDVVGQFARITQPGDIADLFPNKVIFAHGFRNLADGVLLYRQFLEESSSPDRTLIDVLLDVTQAQQQAGNDLPAQMLLDMTMSNTEAQALLATYIGQYCEYNQFPADYWFDPALFRAWFSRQPAAVGIAGNFLAAIETAAAKEAEARKGRVLANRKTQSQDDQTEIITGEQLKQQYGLDPDDQKDDDSARRWLDKDNGGADMSDDVLPGSGA